MLLFSTFFYFLKADSLLNVLTRGSIAWLFAVFLHLSLQSDWQPSNNPCGFGPEILRRPHQSRRPETLTPTLTGPCWAHQYYSLLPGCVTGARGRTFWPAPNLTNPLTLSSLNPASFIRTPAHSPPRSFPPFIPPFIPAPSWELSERGSGLLWLKLNACG